MDEKHVQHVVPFAKASRTLKQFAIIGLVHGSMKHLIGFDEK